MARSRLGIPPFPERIQALDVAGWNAGNPAHFASNRLDIGSALKGSATPIQELLHCSAAENAARSRIDGGAIV